MGNPNSVDDPNSVSWFDLSCTGAGKAVSKIPIAGDVVDIFCDRIRAREDYIQIHPILIENVELKTPNDNTILYLCQKITLTAQYGACRQNFRRYYIDGKNKGRLANPQIAHIKKLPKDPHDIMFGYWAAQF